MIMKCVIVVYFTAFRCDVDDVTFVGMECHQPVGFPFSGCVKVLLKFECVVFVVYSFVYDAVVCE